MRPVLVVVIAVVVLGGVRIFLESNVETASRGPVVEVPKSVGVFDVELTLTFDAGPDAFSIESDGSAPSLLVQLNGEPILTRTDHVAAADSPILLRDVPGVVIGRNELLVQASPVDESVRPAVRLRILQGDEVKADETIWPEFAGYLQGTVSMEVLE